MEDRLGQLLGRWDRGSNQKPKPHRVGLITRLDQGNSSSFFIEKLNEKRAESPAGTSLEVALAPGVYREPKSPNLGGVNLFGSVS